MSSKPAINFSKQNLDMYLLDLAKEYKKRAGRHMPAEIVLIGGASIMINYDFREMTSVSVARKPQDKAQGAYQRERSQTYVTAG